MIQSLPRLSPGILSRKPTTRILVLGAYRPREAKGRLIALRDFLRGQGYNQCYLLSNLRFRKRFLGETVEVYLVKKGRNYLESWADIALFVFLCDASNMGVLSEFDYTQYNLRALLRTSTVFIDESCQFPSLTTSGTIRMSGIDQRFFTDDKSLFRAAKGACLDSLRKLY